MHPVATTATVDHGTARRHTQGRRLDHRIEAATRGTNRKVHARVHDITNGGARHEHGSTFLASRHVANSLAARG